LTVVKPINRFLLENNLRIAQNPCVSPDFCLDWEGLLADVRGGRATEHPKSRFSTRAGDWTLVENSRGDCAWKLHGTAAPLGGGQELSGVGMLFPASWENLLAMKNLVLEHDPASTIFPSAGGCLGRSTIGVGARFTTLHWPAVEWAMSALGIGLTANQNSIPRELVYDVDAMLDGRLDTVPFPFIGTQVPEGHQGQSVEGMSHGCVLSKLRTGFHRCRVPWSFNADHQPIGGKFDAREDALVRGCLLASYITFDLSPELALDRPAALADIPPDLVAKVRGRVAGAGQVIDEGAFSQLLCSVWPALQKMKRRDEKYAAARLAAFTAVAGRRYLRELSIDELPGLTTPETTAVMLALCEALDMPVNFIAPAFGFQKNTPFPDDAALRGLLSRQWAVAERFGASIGFHSGSGKSAGNYEVMGEVTGGALEIKTSGRYTYEMGRALALSSDGADKALWLDWHRFTVDMAVAGAFSPDPTERKMARSFVSTSLAATGKPVEVFASEGDCRAAIEALPPSPDHMFFFEYNFLYVLAAGGRAEKAALGDHSAAGYAQRARFYAISPEARLLYSRGVAGYLIFLAEHTGIVAAARCAAARSLLAGYATMEDFLNDISR
jgi:hypothetical protein